MNPRFGLPLFYAGAIITFIFASQHGVFGLWFTFYAALCLAVYETVVWLALPRHFNVERRFSKSRISSQDSVQIEVAVRWNYPLLLPVPWLKIEDELPSKLAVRVEATSITKFPWWQKSVSAKYQIRDLPRGDYYLQSLNVLSGDALGLITRTVSEPAPWHLVVYPRPLQNAFLDTQMAGSSKKVAKRTVDDQGERVVGARPYRPGDRMQKIHWAVTARTGVLSSREYERTDALDHYLLLFADGQGYGQVPAAFEIALSLSVTCLEGWQRRSQPFQFYALGKEVHRFSGGNSSEYMRILDYLSRAEADGSDSWHKYHQTLVNIPRNAMLNLIVYELGEGLKWLVGLARSRNWQVAIWLTRRDAKSLRPQELALAEWLKGIGIAVLSCEGDQS